MKFAISQKEFLRGLALAQGIAERKSTMPILSNVLLEAGDGGLRARATDLYTTVTCHLEAETQKPGSLALAAKALFDIVKNLPRETLTIEKSDGERAEIVAGPSRFRLVGLPADDYPEVPGVPDEGFTAIPVDVLLALINRTIFSVSQDDTRQHLSGVYLESEGDKLRMVSTDGHRLSKAEEAVAGGWAAVVEGVLIPKKGVGELKRMLEGTEGDCQLAIEQGVLFAKHGAMVLSVRLTDSRFPPYRKVIPEGAERKLVVDRSLLIDALKRVSLMSEDRTKGIRLTLENQKLIIDSDTPDVGEAREEIEVDYDGVGLTIGFNAVYLAEALGRTEGDEVFLEFNEELDPCVVKPVDSDNFLGVVMPLRL